MGVFPCQPSDHAKSSAVFFKSLCELRVIKWAMRERKCEGGAAWPMGYFNKRQSDFSEAVIIKILPHRMFVWGGQGLLLVRRRRIYREVINSPKWLLLDGRQEQSLLLLWAGTASSRMSHSLVLVGMCIEEKEMEKVLYFMFICLQGQGLRYICVHAHTNTHTITAHKHVSPNANLMSKC